MRQSYRSKKATLLNNKMNNSIGFSFNYIFSLVNKFLLSAGFIAMTLGSASAQQNTSNDILTMGNSITAGLSGTAGGTIRCAALGNIIIAADNQPSCRGNGQQNVGGWQPILRSLTGSNTFNFGNSSEITAQMANRLPAALSARPSKYVLILGGTNDVIRNRSISESIANIQRMIDASRAANRIPIVGTIPPLLLGRFASINSRVLALNAAINAIDGVEIADHYEVLVTNWGAHNSGDTIHLGPSGNQIVAQVWAAAIERANQVGTGAGASAVGPILDLLMGD